jgi:hypothetical protein
MAKSLITSHPFFFLYRTVVLKISFVDNYAFYRKALFRFFFHNRRVLKQSLSPQGLSRFFFFTVVFFRRATAV